MITPVKGKITSKFGNRINPITKENQFHNGVDIAAPEGTAIIAPFDGKVEKSFYDDIGGYSLIIAHNNGYKTGYAHLKEKSTLNVGETVKQGQTIAKVGNTGRSTGAHLHFTLTDKTGQKIDPETVFNFS